MATLLFLQARGRVTAPEVADELEVSVRTARRDLEALAVAGIPVYSQAGRGGGWSLIGGARTDLGGITPKVLTQTLRGLERDGLVTRKVYAEVPPRVEYTLTDLGRSLITPIDAVRTWAEQNAEQILATQARYDLAKR